MYGDGVKIGEGNGQWFNSQVYTFPGNTKVIAIEGVNGGGPAGIVGSFSNGLVTDATSWRCSNQLITGWNTAEFDDSSWAPAVVVPHDHTVSQLSGPKIDPAANWIWTANVQRDLTVYCRAKIGK